jgi:exodeoxyribonuclease VII small subunit
MSDRPPTFEEAFNRLQAAVDALERGGLTLDEALDLFEHGMSLATSCKQALDEAELRLTKLLEQHEPLFQSGLIEED